MALNTSICRKFIFSTVIRALSGFVEILCTILEIVERAARYCQVW
jgi:hypothetical protein